ncbi:MAG: DNA polymerase III subunit gamma/tau C-terminal domain-containing protein, partial [Castellaniella sp.]
AQAWPAVAAGLPVGGAARALAMNSEWLSGDDHQIRLRVAIHTYADGGGHDRLRTVLSEYFGRVVRLEVEYGATGDDTAHAVDQAERGRRQQAAEQAAEQDELVRTLAQRFAARVVPGSVRPPAL